MKTIKIKGKRAPLTMAEWKDIEHIVKAHLKNTKNSTTNWQNCEVPKLASQTASKQGILAAI